MGHAMTPWIVFALMTGAALVAVLWPLRRRSVTAAAESGNDAAVYRDQLHEIERDLAAGSLGANEAEAARIEVSRRLLAAEEAQGTRIPDPATNRHMGAKHPGPTRHLSAGIAAIVLTFAGCTLSIARVAFVAPGKSTPFFRHW